jgi:DNA processing protein
VPKADPPDLFASAPLPVAPLDDSQRLACLRLIRSENVGPATFRALINHYGGARQALDALPELGRRAGRTRPVRIHSEAQAKAELEAAEKAGVQLIFTIEPGFPAPLAFADGAPPLLYAKGRIELLTRQIIAVVGSRQASAAGIQIARSFAGAFGQDGYVVGSGLARGIDAVAHQATLDTGTVAVLAGGLDIFYPPEHRALQAAVGERGCLVSEMPLGFQPRAQDFPRRNRIISGISRAVVVVEAARRSGTLITARLANEQGRDVFAVPGHPLDPRAEGTNQLIKEGATMATGPEDVLAALSVGTARFTAPSFDESRPAAPSHFADLTPAAGPGLLARASRPDASPSPHSAVQDADTGHALQLVRRALGPAPVGLDEVVRATGLPARAVQSAMIELALAGAIEMHGSQLVSLRPDAPTDAPTDV